MSINAYWVGMTVLVLYWVAVVVVIVAEDREPSVSLAWILILGLLPGVGLIIYFFAGRNWKGIHSKRKWVRDLRALESSFMEPIHARYREYAEAARREYRGTPTERLIQAISTERENDRSRSYVTRPSSAKATGSPSRSAKPSRSRTRTRPRTTSRSTVRSWALRIKASPRPGRPRRRVRSRTVASSIRR